MLKKKLIIKVITIFIVFLGVVAFLWGSYSNIINRPLRDDNSTVVVEDFTFSEILEGNNSFRGKGYIKLYNKIKDIKITAQKGRYEFPKDITLPELIDSLQKGKYNTSVVKVTIPEGYTIEKIGDLLDKQGVTEKGAFLQACLEYGNGELKKSGVRYGIEGYLFPDTYFLEKDMKPEKVLDKLVGQFNRIMGKIEKDTGSIFSKDELHRIVTKASVIEREVKLKEEKYLVSSVIENRIAMGMKLQIDATVLYAKNEHKDRVLYEDLKYKSPYNTYYVTGLPVGPISNPGEDSLRAAIEPNDTDFLFYMTKDGTNHKFFTDYSEFLGYKNKK